ncbi:MAG: hypothetical protein AB8F94_10335 [Saprospiraceae bacterium]
MEKVQEKEPSKRSIQDYLSLGYLYLLALGIIREVIYFSFLDVNILSYSNVLDVILSPLVYIAKNPIVIFTLFILGGIIHFINKYKLKKKNKAAVESGKTEERVYSDMEILEGSFILIAFLAFSFFLGTGIGSGNKHGKKLANGEFNVTHEITFMDKEKIQARVLGSNSQYIFYVLEEEKHVSISPIPGNVKKINKLPSDK